jgi:predicted transposase YbfD/YdcC
VSRAPGSEATEVDKGHGRIEKRTVRTTPILTADGWPGLTLGIEIRRERTVKGQTTVEVEYAITSLSVNAATLLKVIRDHWRIEHSLHWVRDATLGEDACRVRSGSAPQVLASLRNAVVYLLSGVKAESRVAAIERMQARPEEAKALIGLK